jgi:hypothetical protein
VQGRRFCSQESLCREIEEKVDQWGVNRVKAEAVVLQEGKLEAPWELLYDHFE